MDERNNLNRELVEHCAKAAKKDFGIYASAAAPDDVLWQAISATVIHESVKFLKNGNPLRSELAQHKAADGGDYHRGYEDGYVDAVKRSDDLLCAAGDDLTIRSCRQTILGQIGVPFDSKHLSPEPRWGERRPFKNFREGAA